MTKSLHFFLWIAFSFVVITSCNKGIMDHTSSQVIDEDVLFAQRLFEEEVLRLSDSSTRTAKDSNRPSHIFQLGTITPDWSSSEIILNKKTKQSKNVEVPISTTFRYRVLQKSSEEKKARRVKVYQELLVTSNSNASQNGVFVVSYIATNNYIKWNKGLLNYRFDNSGDMKKYSGLKIYTDLEGRIIRVNKYLNGKKTTGIFVPRYASPDDKVLLHAFLKEQFKHMHFQYGIRIAPSTRSWEDDQNWSYSDWDQDPYDDGHYYAPDDELDGGFCGYYDHFWFEHNGSDGGSDGYDDSYDPDSNNGYNDWDNDYDSLHQNNQNYNGEDQNQQDDDKRKFGNKQDKKKLETKDAKRDYKGWNDKVTDKNGNEKVLNNCFEIAMRLMTALGSPSPTTQCQLMKLSSDGKSIEPIRNDLSPIIRDIVRNLDNGSPVLAGADYKTPNTGAAQFNSDKITDHFVPIYGYEIISDDEIRFFYIETGGGSARKEACFSEDRYFTYHSGDNTITGDHWMNHRLPVPYTYTITQIRY